MADRRVQIDGIDVEIVRLLATRSRCIDHAVALKKIEELPARTTDRVAEVLDKVAAIDSRRGLDPDLARSLWSDMIARSIRRESKELGRSGSCRA